MFVITAGPDGCLYDWQAGVVITPEGAEAIDEALLCEVGDCPLCGERQRELRMGICFECFHEGPDHE